MTVLSDWQVSSFTCVPACRFLPDAECLLTDKWNGGCDVSPTAQFIPSTRHQDSALEFIVQTWGRCQRGCFHRHRKAVLGRCLGFGVQLWNEILSTAAERVRVQRSPRTPAYSESHSFATGQEVFSDLGLFSLHPDVNPLGWAWRLHSEQAGRTSWSLFHESLIRELDALLSGSRALS